MLETITIGTRGSDLALKQIEITKRALHAVAPSLDIRVQIIKTEGDLNSLPIPADVVGKGWFTKEIEHALQNNEIDLAVHSLKDVGDVSPEGLVIDAFISREDPRDVLVTKNGEPFEKLRQGAIVGTDSVRRQVQIKALRPDLVVESIRGNVPTRLQKLKELHYDAVVLAAAGLKRLNLENKIVHFFTFDEMTPAPGQGALALQTRENHTELRELLKKINGETVARAVHIERAFSRAVGGGCKSPVGAHAFKDGNNCTLIGFLLHTDGRLLRESVTAPWNESADMGEELAKKLLAS